MNNRLSFSSVSTYSSCGKKYQYQYIDKLRPKSTSSALLFGTAFDKAIEAVLKDPSCNEKDVFDDTWSRQKINKVEIDLPTSLLIKYSKADHCPELLLEDDLEYLEQNKTLALEVLHNLTCWLVMRRKGHLMLDANRKHVLPKIKKVLKVQVPIELSNESSGDTLVGYADVICELQDDRKVVLDYKTSSIEYPLNAVRDSEQLTIYAHALNIKNIGYVVFNKNIKKERKCEKCSTVVQTSHHSCPVISLGTRCGGTLIISRRYADWYFLIDEINIDTENKVLDNIEKANLGIKNKVFEKDTSACFKFGRCSYYDLCHKDDIKDLEEVK